MIEPSDKKRLIKVTTLIGLLGLLVALAGLNRKFPPQFFRVPVLDIMSTYQILPLFFFAPVGIIILWLLFCAQDGNKSTKLTLVMIIGFFLVGAGFGMHTPTNAMPPYYRSIMSGPVKQSLYFYDNHLGHWLFFAGFILVSIAGAIAEIRNPYKSCLPIKLLSPFIIIGLVVATAIYINMVWEKTSIDIMVLSVTVGIVAANHLMHGSKSLRRLPTTLSLFIGYGGGILSTLIHWLL